MPSSQRVYLPAAEGDWNEIEGEDAGRDMAQGFSAASATTAVFFTYSTWVDFLSISVFDHGEVVRELTHTENGWESKGAPMPFENAAMLAALLLGRSYDAYEVLNALLGRDDRVPHPQLGDQPEDDDFDGPQCSHTVYVTREIARELHKLYVEHGWSAGRIVAAAWEATKAELYAMPGSGDVGDAPPPRDVRGIRRGTHDVPALPKSAGNKVELRLAFDRPVLEEIQRLAVHRDCSLSRIIDEAYRRARPLVAG